MIKREAGFTLVELMITMVVFVLIIASASVVFTGLLTQFKQQSRIAETNIEGIVGLEILRQDIEHAGYGLPWNGLITYSESSSDPFGLNDAPTDPPRGIVSENNTNTPDYLVVKAVNLAQNDASQKWTTLKAAPFTSPYNPRQWTPATENLENTDRVFVLSSGSTAANAKTLINDGTDFYTTFGNVTNSPWSPTDVTETRLVYGVADSTVASLRRPFNRADYFITTVDSDGTNITPQRCAPNTGVLVKATMNHDANGTYTYLPLLDCVADMQVIFGLDNDGDGDFEPGVAGSTDGYSGDISALTAQEIREQVKENRVYILAHEGQRDSNYTYPSNPITVGEFGLGRDFNLATTIGGNWQNYRWKLYTLVVKPNNLR